jgi:hypothetical protein
MPPETARTLGAALADALARADSTQEIALRAQRRERKLAVFTRRFTTSLVAFVDADNRLQIHLVDADRELPAGEDGRVPEPIAGRSMHGFRTVPGPHIAPLSERAVAVEWRADLFRDPVTGDAAGGRRTILMESADGRRALTPHEEEAPASEDPALRRRLAELDAARRAGTLSEAEYQRQRARLLQSSD